MGFTVGQVVHDYGSVCQSVTELAEEIQAPITTEEFRTLNQCLDDAIAGAVTEYTRQRERSIAADGTERLGELAHGLRNRLSAAMLAFEMLKTGSVGVSGSTAAILDRNLRGLRDLIDLTLADVRLQARLLKRTRVSLAELVEEIEIDASLEANARHVELSVAQVAVGVDVHADRSLLAAAVANLVQNAVKFTHPRGHVTLRVLTTEERVLIEVQDECGGLPRGAAEEMFAPHVQRSSDRTGVGLGLSIARKSVEANGGILGVRDLPGTGCVFTIALPRLPTDATV
jgi:signal transduction histidine kinase